MNRKLLVHDQIVDLHENLGLGCGDLLDDFVGGSAFGREADGDLGAAGEVSGFSVNKNEEREGESGSG